MILLDRKLYSVEPSNKEKIYSLQEKNKHVSEKRSERQQVYNTKKWRSLRLAKLYDCPVCEECGKQFQTQVHHIDSFMCYEGLERIAKAYDYENLKQVCTSCHQKEHARKIIIDD